MSRMQQSDSSSTLERALALLWQLYAEPEGLTASELAARLDTQRTALYRLLRPFLREQFIRRDTRKRYYLGFGITALARAVAEPLESIVRVPLQRLADASGSTAVLVADTDGILVTVASAQPAVPGIHLSVPTGFVHDGSSSVRTAVQAIRARESASEATSREDRPPLGIGDGSAHGFTAAKLVRIPIIGTDAFVAVMSVGQLDPRIAEQHLEEAARHLDAAI